jgi:hypothetical protein
MVLFAGKCFENVIVAVAATVDLATLVQLFGYDKYRGSSAFVSLTEFHMK